MCGISPFHFLIKNLLLKKTKKTTQKKEKSFELSFIIPNAENGT